MKKCLCVCVCVCVYSLTGCLLMGCREGLYMSAYVCVCMCVFPHRLTLVGRREGISVCVFPHLLTPRGT